MRVSQGGHDVPVEKLKSRFPRTLTNLQAAVRKLPYVILYDNDDLNEPFRRVGTFEKGKLVWSQDPLPDWMPTE